MRKLCRMDKDVKSMDGVLNFGINKLRSAKLVVYSRNKDSVHMMSRATKTYKDSGSGGSKDIIQGAVDELLHWLDHVTKETQYTKLKLMESMRWMKSK